MDEKKKTWASKVDLGILIIVSATFIMMLYHVIKYHSGLLVAIALGLIGVSFIISILRRATHKNKTDWLAQSFNGLGIITMLAYLFHRVLPHLLK